MCEGCWGGGGGGGGGGRGRGASGGVMNFLSPIWGEIINDSSLRMKCFCVNKSGILKIPIN